MPNSERSLCETGNMFKIHNNLNLEVLQLESGIDNLEGLESGIDKQFGVIFHVPNPVL